LEEDLNIKQKIVKKKILNCDLFLIINLFKGFKRDSRNILISSNKRKMIYKCRKLK